MFASARLLLFHGDEPFLVEEAFLQSWRQVTLGLTSELDAERLDGSASIEELVVAASSVGFFNPGRVVGIRDWRYLGLRSTRRNKKAHGGDAEAAAEAMRALPAESTVILTAGSTVATTNPILRVVADIGEVREFPRLARGSHHGWVLRRAEAIGLKLDGPAARLLVEAVGDDLGLLDSELRKLAVFAEGKRVGVTDVHALVPDTAEHQVWLITDALLADPGRALTELERALASGEPPGRLSFFLLRQLRLLLAASSAPAGTTGRARLAEAMAGEGRPPSDYGLGKALSQAAAADPALIERLYRQAATNEAASRNGDLDETAALRLLVISAAAR
jgi:DNA polymerase-3 subunit delta